MLHRIFDFQGYASEAATVAFGALQSFVEALEEKGGSAPPSYQVLIICPDCGKNPAYDGRCPKCGGNSWMPAGNRRHPSFRRSGDRGRAAVRR